MIKFFYQSGAMAYDGNGWFWHKLMGEFPDFSFVTKTITKYPKMGLPFAVLPMGKSVWNKIMLSNPGIDKWIKYYYPRVKNKNNLILSIHGDDNDIQEMCYMIENLDMLGVELNYSCPNVKNQKNKEIPKTKHDLYIKLSHDQNPNMYDMDKIKRIHLNSVNMYGGGVSGKMAQKCNWDFIKKYNEDFEIAGVSWINENDIKKLEVMGCKYFGIGSVIIINPNLVKGLP